MNILFNKNLSRVHDAMEGLVLSYKDNYQQIYQDYNLRVSQAAEQALTLISKKLKFNLPCSELLFGQETELAVSFARSRFLPADITIDRFTDHLRSLSEKEVKLILLSNLNAASLNKTYAELENIAANDSLIIDFLRQAEISAAIKWEALEFLNDIPRAMDSFARFVDLYLPIYLKILEKNKKLIESFENELDAGIQAEGIDYVTRRLRDSINLDAENISVGILFFRSRSVTCILHQNRQDHLFVFIGIDYEETVRNALSDGDIVFAIFKNLADKTRFQILNLLKEGDLYGQEIADKVGITLATVSYHMSYLLAAKCVKLEKMGQKGYYSLRKESLKQCADFLNNHFHLDSDLSDH